MDFEYYEKIVNECKSLAKRKNKDYGDNSIKSFGGLGLLIRISDKVDRLTNILFKKNKPLVNESVEDTVKDIINYSVYLLMILKSNNKNIK